MQPQVKKIRNKAQKIGECSEREKANVFWLCDLVAIRNTKPTRKKVT
jgi:hypothetical protein